MFDKLRWWIASGLIWLADWIVGDLMMNGDFEGKQE
jgi:hypothetical protein